MEFKVVQDIVQSIINTVEQTAISSVLALKKHTFTTHVENFPEFPKEIKVNNQVSPKITESKLEQIRAILARWKFPREIAVSNFPKFPQYPKEIKVNNFPDFPKTPEYPKKIEISNQPITQLENIEESNVEIIRAIKALRLDPKINVEAPKPERVIVPPSQVTVNEKPIDYEKFSKAIASQIPEIDYEKLASALSKEMAGMVITGGGGGGGRYAFQNTLGEKGYGLTNILSQLSVVQEERWGLNDSSKSGATTYTGEEDVDGNWIVRKIVKTGSNISMSYATKKNNEGITNYTDAWDNKVGLIYDSYSVAFALT